MDDMERALDDGVNTFKALTKVCLSSRQWLTLHPVLVLCVSNELYSLPPFSFVAPLSVCFHVCSLQDGRLVSGAGAFEIELAKQLTSYSEASRLQCHGLLFMTPFTPYSPHTSLHFFLCCLTYFVPHLVFTFSLQTCPGLEQYAIRKFAEALDTIVRALAENAGMKVCPSFEHDLLE